MEEKRKLEKIILADIDRKASDYKQERNSARTRLANELTDNPPEAARKHLATWKDAQKAQEKAEAALEALGFRVCSYRDGGSLAIDYSKRPKPLVEFDKATNDAIQKFTELNRSYTVKLFAGGIEAQELFKALGADLATITA